MAIGNEHYDLKGISAGHVGPVVFPLHLPFPERVNAFYGQNGVGKSWVLNLLESALRGISPSPESKNGRHENGQAFAHLHFSVHDPGDNDVYASPLLGSIFRALVRALPTERGLLLQSGEDPDEVFDEDEDALEEASLTDLVCSFIRLAGKSRGWTAQETHQLWSVAAEGRYTLAAVGSADDPRWRVWLSHKPTQSERDDLKQRTELTSALSQFKIDASAAFVVLDYIGQIPRAPKLIPLPSWIQLPVLDLGIEISAPPAEIVGGTDDLNWAVSTVEAAKIRIETETGQQVDLIDESGKFSAPIMADIKKIADRANAYLARIFPAPPLLVFEFGSPSTWLTGVQPFWAFLPDNSKRTFPIEDTLSESQLRWAQIAIAVASARTTDRPVILVCDEPERGLHLSAARRLPGALAYITEHDEISAFIASHSHYTLAHPEVHATRIDRSKREGTTLFHNTISLIDTESRRRSEAELGLTAAELQSLMRVAVVVEGLHDEIVFKHLIRGTLDASQAAIFPLYGGKNAKTLPAARMMIDGSEAPIVVVMDHLTNDVIAPAWAEIKMHARAGNHASAVEVADRDLRSGGGAGELTFLRQLARAAIANYSVDRIVIHGLSYPDVICYLSERILFAKSGGPQEWDQLIDAWRKHPSERVRNKSIKDYLSGRLLFPSDEIARNKLIEDSAVAMATEGVKLHADVAKLASYIRKLGESSST